MNIKDSVSTGLGKFLVFSGRATRSEFWWYYLFLVIISIIINIVSYEMFALETALKINTFVSVAMSATIFAAGSRRLHDIGKSGWWQLLTITGSGVIFLVVWWATATRNETNKYGQTPS